MFLIVREPGDLRDHLQAAPSCRANLSGCEHPPPPLVELGANGIPALANRLRVDHADPHTAGTHPKESRHPESIHHMVPECIPIHLLWRVS